MEMLSRAFYFLGFVVFLAFLSLVFAGVSKEDASTSVFEMQKKQTEQQLNTPSSYGSNNEQNYKNVEEEEEETASQKQKSDAAFFGLD